MPVPVTLPVTQAARSKVVTVLSNPTSGFNPQFAQTITQSPYAGKVRPATIDFTGNTKSFILEKVDLGDYMSMNPNTPFPIIALWCESALPQRRGMQKRAVFSGSCLLYIDLHLSTPNQTSPADLHLTADAYLDTLFNVLNYPGGANEATLTAGPVYWLSELAVRGRTAARKGEKGWYQTISTSAPVLIQY